MFEVWDKSLDRRLAVKVLRPDVAWTPGMLARFKQEAKAVAQLAHLVFRFLLSQAEQIASAT